MDQLPSTPPENCVLKHVQAATCSGPPVHCFCAYRSLHHCHTPAHADAAIRRRRSSRARGSTLHGTVAAIMARPDASACARCLASSTARTCNQGVSRSRSSKGQVGPRSERCQRSSARVKQEGESASQAHEVDQQHDRRVAALALRGRRRQEASRDSRYEDKEGTCVAAFCQRAVAISRPRPDARPGKQNVLDPIWGFLQY
jgi:hypothetical protein